MSNLKRNLKKMQKMRLCNEEKIYGPIFANLEESTKLPSIKEILGPYHLISNIKRLCFINI